MSADRGFLPSWRPGPTRERLVGFLDASEAVPADQRVAVFDNDGTLWCERPVYAQLAFFVDALRSAVSEDPRLGDRPEYAALLEGDREGVASLGLGRVALALAELFAGIEPAEFADRCRRFVSDALHPTLGVPFARTVYQPMVELLTELRARGFATFIVTGGGTEFVRAVSNDRYGVPPEGVVGTLIGYQLVRRNGRPVLVRTATLQGAANEGPAKIEHIQAFLGRHPILAVGNSAGDWDMLEYTSSLPGPSLGVLVDHDDAEREFAYEGEAATFETELTGRDMADRHGWLVVSMQRDWAQVFPSG
ncbi:MAG: HAD family hydrolase [Acidimicrobiia bacterium]